MSLINGMLSPSRAVKRASESCVRTDRKEVTSPVGEDGHEGESGWNLDERWKWYSPQQLTTLSYQKHKPVYPHESVGVHHEATV